MQLSPGHVALADRLFDILQAARYRELPEILAPDCVVWHSFDPREQTVGEALEVFGQLPKIIERTRFKNVRRDFFAGGFVQRHDLVQGTASGRTISAPCCLVVEVRGERITRIEEYLDGAVVAEIVAEMSR